jgi:multiple sugar transport system permease protein
MSREDQGRDVIKQGLKTAKLHYLYPFFSAISLSLHDVNYLRPATRPFVGVANFIRLLTREQLFSTTLLNSLIFTLASVVFEYIVGLASALLLNSTYVRIKNLPKALVLLPWAVPIAINSLIWKFLLSGGYGFIDQMLNALGFRALVNKNWLGDLALVMPTVVFVNVWRSFPFYTITLTAGLATVPRELYEAAAVDGAVWLSQFWHITLPGIRHVSAVIVVFHLIWTFTNFDVIYLLTGGGPLHVTEVLPTLLYQQAFVNFDMGYAAAMGVFLFLVLSLTAGPLYSWLNK